MRPSYTRKKINGIMYTLHLRENEFYADKVAKILREDGYKAVILSSDRENEFEIWRSVNKQ